MPRGKTNPFTKNLSVIIPLSVHRKARVGAIRCGAPSFAAYVAFALDHVPEQLPVSELVKIYGMEMLLTIPH